MLMIGRSKAIGHHHHLMSCSHLGSVDIIKRIAQSNRLFQVGFLHHPNCSTGIGCNREMHGRSKGFHTLRSGPAFSVSIHPRHSQLDDRHSEIKFHVFSTTLIRPWWLVVLTLNSSSVRLSVNVVQIPFDWITTSLRIIRFVSKVSKNNVQTRCTWKKTR